MFTYKFQANSDLLQSSYYVTNTFHSYKNIGRQSPFILLINSKIVLTQNWLSRLELFPSYLAIARLCFSIHMFLVLQVAS